MKIIKLSILCYHIVYSYNTWNKFNWKWRSKTVLGSVSMIQPLKNKLLNYKFKKITYTCSPYKITKKLFLFIFENEWRAVIIFGEGLITKSCAENSHYIVYTLSWVYLVINDNGLSDNNNIIPITKHYQLIFLV